MDENEVKSKVQHKEGKKKTKINLRPILILVAIVAVIVVVVAVVKNNVKTKETNPEQQTIENQEIADNSETSLIDNDNLDNAKKTDTGKENTSEKVAKERSIDGIKITDIKLYAEGGTSHFTANLENTNKSDTKERVLVIKFTNKDGSEYAELQVSLPEIKAGETNSINAATTLDITNAYDFTIE